MQLNIVNVNGKNVADSRQIAEMIGKQHGHLLRDIDNYVAVLIESNFGVNEFFIESSYQDSIGRTLKKYDCTRKGCDMIANKMTGQKGILFTAAYVTKFEELERKQSLNKIVPLSDKQALIQALRLSADVAEELESVKEEVQELKEKVEEQITIDHGEQRRIQKAVSRKVYEIEQEPENRGELFRQLYREIKDRWAVASYRDVRRNELDEVLKYIEAWKPRAA